MLKNRTTYLLSRLNTNENVIIKMKINAKLTCFALCKPLKVLSSYCTTEVFSTAGIRKILSEASFLNTLYITKPVSYRIYDFKLYSV